MNVAELHDVLKSLALDPVSSRMRVCITSPSRGLLRRPVQVEALWVDVDAGSGTVVISHEPPL